MTSIDNQVLDYVLYPIEVQLCDQFRNKVAVIIQNQTVELFLKHSKLHIIDQIINQIDNS